MCHSNTSSNVAFGAVSNTPAGPAARHRRQSRGAVILLDWMMTLVLLISLVAGARALISGVDIATGNVDETTQASATSVSPGQLSASVSGQTHAS